MPGRGGWSAVRMRKEAGTGSETPDSLIRSCRRTIVHGFVLAGIFSGFINLLQLTVPLFMLQVHDRVIASQSVDTLKVLVMLAFGALTLYAMLEFIRSVTFQALSGQLIGRLNLPAIQAAMTASLERGSMRATEVLARSQRSSRLHHRQRVHGAVRGDVGADLPGRHVHAASALRARRRSRGDDHGEPEPALRSHDAEHAEERQRGEHRKHLRPLPARCATRRRSRRWACCRR